MANRAIKSIAWIFVVLVAMTIAAAAYLVFALNSGPMSVGFLKDTVRERVSDSIPGIRLDLDDVVIEQGEGNSHPNLRMTNVRLTDADGNLIARAPRAAISVDIGEILSGTVKPKRLELIGARILARRKADGSIAMGFTNPVAASGKSDAGLAAEPGEASDDRGGGSAGSMMDTIARVLQGGEGSAASSLETIEVTNAQISFKDEIQDHLWLSPRANLRFKQAEGGFALFVDADISADGPTWRTELLTTFRKDANVYRVIAKVYDVTPADLARKLFSFNQLANINLPLSGEMQFDIDNKGAVLNAGGVLAIQAGRVSFPDYIADPLVIDEGLARFSFEPETGHVVVTDSKLMIRGSEARFSGRIAPVRNDQDRIVSARIELDARNLNINSPNAAAAAGEASAIDEFKLRGEAIFDKRRFVVDDLIVLSGKGGVRVRGQFVGEGDAVGVYVAGRGRALGHELIRKLWPPVMAKQSREWYRASVSAGTVDDAEFRVRLSGPQINAALDGRPLPPDAVDLKFTASGVEFLYSEGLPKVTAGKGTFTLSGTVFDIKFDAATIPLPSGNSLAITGGNMQITQLALPISPATMSIRLDGDVAAYHEYADLPALKLVEGSNFDVNKVTGRGLVTLNLAMPLKPGITSTDFTVSAAAKLTGGRIREAVEGLDLADADLDLKLEDAVISASGTAQLGEKRAKISWRRPLSKSGNADEDLTISATLSDRDRQKLGISLDPWMVGPIPVDVSMVRRGEQIASATVEADLSKVRMALDALSWSRPPTAKTKAKFKVNMSDAKAIVIDDLEVTGKDLKIIGKVRVKRDGGLIDASLPRFILSDTNQLALEVDNSSGQLRMGVGGASLDARPLISQMMSSTVAAGSDASRNPPVSINTNISRIIVHRGELVNNLRGSLTLQGGAVQVAELSGNYVNGAPVTMRIQREGGNRRMRVTGRDAGATLRAVNLYSKISGGTIDFGAILGNPGEGAIKRGLLEVRNFAVQNEAAINEIDRTTRDAGRGAGGPRNNGLRLSRLSVPFSVDHQFVRIGDALVQGPEIGASAQGIIRKADLAMDIGGTIIPAYALNSAISNVPVIGDVLTGGKGQGVFGLNFALQGSMNQPRFLVNPVSAIAPGIFRNLFNIGGGQTNADGTARAPGSQQARDGNLQTDR